MCLTFSVSDICPMIANKLPATFVLFHVLSLWVCPRSLSTLDSAHVRKYQALHACTTSIFAFRRVGAWEQGYNYHTEIEDGVC